MTATDTIFYSHLFLCGHLNVKTETKANIVSGKIWIKEELEKDYISDEDGTITINNSETFTYKELCNMYYESYIDSLVSVKNLKMSTPYDETAHYTLSVNKGCKLIDNRFTTGEWLFKVDKLHLFFFPYNICIFAIEIEDPINCAPNDLTLAHFILREVNNYMGWEEIPKTQTYPKKCKWTMKLNAPEYLECIKPLLDLCDPVGPFINPYSNLTLTGGKLKSFQLILSDNISNDFLYEMGTLSPVGCVNSVQNHLSPSKEYYYKMIQENTVSVFRNWKALALFDTFTVLFKTTEKGILFTWRNFYFRLIYIHLLYQKTMLFVVNRKFRSKEETNECRNLLHDMKQLQHWYAFPRISYNFLPQMIYKAIDHGLEIAEEREALQHHIEQETARVEKINDYHIGKLVLFITFITIASALYDGTSLLSEAFNIETGTLCYQILALCISIFVIFTMIFIYKKYKNEKI